MNRLFPTFLFSLILLLSFHASAWAQTSAILLIEDLQIETGDSFFAQGEYYWAITEYKKLAIGNMFSHFLHCHLSSMHLTAGWFANGKGNTKGVKDHQGQSEHDQRQQDKRDEVKI